MRISARFLGGIIAALLVSILVVQIMILNQMPPRRPTFADLVAADTELEGQAVIDSIPLVRAIGVVTVDGSVVVEGTVAVEGSVDVESSYGGLPVEIVNEPIHVIGY